jgi:hypothetical protein
LKLGSISLNGIIRLRRTSPDICRDNPHKTGSENLRLRLGEDTYRAVKDKFKIRKIDLKKVKGKSAEIMVYEVIQS